jgi:hypothetical protein
MSYFNFQDYNKTITSVIAVAQGPDGKPALLSADKPAGAIAEELEYNANKQVTSVKYYASFDPITNTGSDLIATRNVVWHTTGNGAGQPAYIYWS